MTDQKGDDSTRTYPVDPAVMEQLWDERYADGGAVWSGEPNGALVAEASKLKPARAVDVGCGEGADAVWLAGQGWQVTALDVSSLALQRAKHAADSAGAAITWLHAGLEDAELPEGEFDLVAALYPALMRTADHGAERALLDAVAPGGTLLFVHHAQFGSQPSAWTGDGPSGRRHAESPGHDPGGAGDGPGPRSGMPFGPGDLVGVEDVRSFIESAGDAWEVSAHEERPREVTGGAGAHFHEDIVLVARRRK